MEKDEVIRRMEQAGLTHEEAVYYVAAYPPEEWAEIIKWASSPPGLDACDDVEADEWWA